MHGIPLPWYCPEERAISNLTGCDPAAWQRSGGRTSLRSRSMPISIGHPLLCRCETAGQGGTWITAEFIAVYTELHRRGMAHSVEAWDEDGQLAGGLMAWMRAASFAASLCSISSRMPQSSRCCFSSTICGNAARVA